MSGGGLPARLPSSQVPKTTTTQMPDFQDRGGPALTPTPTGATTPRPTTERQETGPPPTQEKPVETVLTHAPFVMYDDYRAKDTAPTGNAANGAIGFLILALLYVLLSTLWRNINRGNSHLRRKPSRL